MNGAKILIFQFLAFGRRRTKQRATGIDEVGTFIGERALNQEVFLLAAERGGDALAAGIA